ncbi:prolyl oligopeptidase family serine peptidase [Sinirhodobacter sp. WL0062]|uniref:Prolyl oligopeptidase family serine peptidase n=1 Tax=Rhodobacter flavimaris TaxID=2907145 RepID=A0ABS8YYP2_9RHOB|nr:prolyl oligopeptidase family serine peptidase [Sinirhodobacter sp. WL0062]MCE5974937.1 prolyl oligopeptidase family serine peptidase [Sinirhodobacter sp. WL0062]
MPEPVEKRHFGSWASPISPNTLAPNARKIEQVCVDNADIYWIETRPEQGGRSTIMRQSAEGQQTEILPRWFNARTLVNSYGGGAMSVRGATVIFTQFSRETFPKTSDQRVHRLDPGKTPVPITPPAAASYADFEIDPDRRAVYCVMEEQTFLTNGQATQSLVALDLDGVKPPRILAQGEDFYAAPRLSPDGTQLAWLSWSYPSMPWEGTRLWTAKVDPSGVLRDINLLAGAPAMRTDGARNPVLKRLMRYSDDAIGQPAWSPQGSLYALSDRVEIDGDRWLNLCSARNGQLEPVTLRTAEFGAPAWQLGGSSFSFLSDGRILAAFTSNGVWALAVIDPETGKAGDLDTPFTEIAHLHVSKDNAIFVGGSFTEPAALIRLDPHTGAYERLRETTEKMDEEIRRCISVPEPISFPTGEDGSAQSNAFFYAPCNPCFEGAEDETPPLILLVHGGPTAAASASLNLTIQFFTSRGFAVADMNYRGSTGFGRSYRRAMYGHWGEVDVEDCVALVKALAKRATIDPNRVISRGGSSGGYTTLALAAFTDLLSVAASYYGISDLEMIAKITDKLEAHYAELLIGPYPSASKLFRARSPLYHAQKIACPIILFQGLEDPVVPPAQAQMLIDEMNARKLPLAYEFYADESHGFRKAESIIQSLEEELSFYGTILGFTPAGSLRTPQIHNLGTIQEE